LGPVAEPGARTRHADAADNGLFSSVGGRYSGLRPTLVRLGARTCAAEEFLRLRQRFPEDQCGCRDLKGRARFLCTPHGSEPVPLRPLRPGFSHQRADHYRPRRHTAGCDLGQP
jgi:hypothetical protein